MDTQARWGDARRLLHEALDLEPARRDAFLRERCAQEPDLLAEVQSLLSWVDESDAFLERPVLRVADLVPEESGTPLIGRTLGAWRITDVIGHGGMGVVYRAERADAAFRRIVAIKVVRHGPHAADIGERFQRERETLAALDHPNIARLIDGGSTPDGEPYFVMEYVDGVRVDHYCDEHRLSVDERLALFRTICTAVEYAHHALVVHRDIKPDNILVTRDGTPKLLDFGIARVLSDERTRGDADGRAAVTWMMTPDYASPEQITGGPVTIATDVYSLGVLLHVLLTGRGPYRLDIGSRMELGVQLANAALPAPSRLVADGADAPSRAAARRTTPSALSRRLAGDLDAIVLRALARDLPVRYRSVEQLLDELARHRARLPVAARGDAWPYLARTFVRRNRLAFSVAAVFVLVIVLGAGAVLWQASLAAEARARAERRFDDVRRLANVFMFDVHDEIVNVPGTTRARALMVQTASTYLEGLAGEAAGDLALQRELAAAFVKVGDAQGHPTSANIGDTAGARASYERAIALAGAILAAAPGDDEAERTRAMAHRRLGDVLAWAGDPAAAVEHAEISRVEFAALRTRPRATAEDRLQAAIGELKLGDLLGNPNFPNLRRSSDAMRHYVVARDALLALDADGGDDRVRRYVGIIFERVGTMYEVARDWTRAAEAYGQSFEIRRTLAATAPHHTDVQRDLAIAYEKLGNVQLASGDHEGAERSYRGALRQFEELADRDPSNVIAARSAAISREKLAGTLSPQDHRPDVLALLASALATHQHIAAGDPENAQARCDAARIHETMGNASARPAPARPGGGACAQWRAGLRLTSDLLSGGMACVTSADRARLVDKVAQCP